MKINLRELMEREGIYQIRHYLQGRISVTLTDGRIGVAEDFSEALAKAKRPDADSVRRAA